MSRDFETMHRQNKGALKRAFEEETPRILERFQGNALALKIAGALLEERASARGVLEGELERSRTQRVAETVVKLWEERGREMYGVPRPSWAEARAIDEKSYREEAAGRVELEIEGQLAEFDRETQARLASLATQNDQVSEQADTSAQRLTAEQTDATTARPVRSPEEPGREMPPHLKAEVHAAMNEANQARDQLRRIFEKNRLTLIEEARVMGAPDPQSDVMEAHQESLRAVDKREHRKVHEAFERHGWSYQQQDTVFLRPMRQNESFSQEQTSHAPARDETQGFEFGDGED